MVGNGSAKDPVDITISNSSSYVPDHGVLLDTNEAAVTRRRALESVANLKPFLIRSGGKTALSDQQWEVTQPRCDFRDFQGTIQKPWLHGQTSLKKTGQIICAELEVAILFMQKQLGKVIVSLIT